MSGALPSASAYLNKRGLHRVELPGASRAVLPLADMGYAGLHVRSAIYKLNRMCRGACAASLRVTIGVLCHLRGG